MKIDCDSWLSDIFGHGVFKVSVSHSDEVEPINKADDLKLLVSHQSCIRPSFYYAKIPTERVDQVHALTSRGFGVVDVNITFARQPAVVGIVRPPNIEVCDDILPDHHDAVLDIAASSFVFSRFHLDPEISTETANLIKREWVRSYINKARGERLMVALLGGNPVGFLAVLATAVEGRPCRTIDLIAVDKRRQGRGVGKALVSSFVESYADERTLLRVGTQAANIPSMRLYESCGFFLEETAYVMHAHAKKVRVPA